MTQMLLSNFNNTYPKIIKSDNCNKSKFKHNKNYYYNNYNNNDNIRKITVQGGKRPSLYIV